MKKLIGLILAAVLVYYGLAAVIDAGTRAGAKYVFFDVRDRLEMLDGKR